jgi:signal transduction histidine kinase
MADESKISIGRSNLGDRTRYGHSSHFLLLALVIAIVVFGGLLFVFSSSRMREFSFMSIFGPASLVILLGMTGLNVYASRFYRDVFYQFLALGWFANAIYIGLEASFPLLDNDLPHALHVYIFSLISILPFWFGSFVTKGGDLPWRKYLAPMMGWGFWLVSSYILCTYLTKSWWPNGSFEKRFMVDSLGGIVFSSWVFFQTAKALEGRLNYSTHGKWATIFPLTFYVYAFLQPFYLLRLASWFHSLTYAVFAIALLTKITNSVSSLSIIFRDVAEVEHRLTERNWLADLGALTASIEHDVRNPLQIIDNKIAEMRRKYQANDDILSRLKEIEAQNVRIFATTEIIPVLRGEEEYYTQFMEKVSIRDIVLKSVRAVKEEMNTDNIHFSSDDRILFVKGYRPMLQQAVVNILKNAIEAIQEGKVERGLVRISWSLVDGQVQIAFIDNGAGISPENIGKVTSLFTTKKEKKPNSGIGLFITDRIVDFHRGKLLFESEGAGKGATVSVFLPVWHDNG